VAEILATKLVEPMNMRSLAALLLCLGAGLTTKSAETAELASLDATVHAYEEFYGITGGAVAVLRDDQVVYKKTFGHANVEFSVPVRADTRFQLSSSTKLFTSTLMTILAREGLVEFAMPVRSYLPELPASWSDVLLEDIMSHLSGLPEVLECDENEDRDVALSCVYDLERPVPRRKKFIYNQTNYLLAMMVIESVTGKSYPDALASRVLVPAGMTSAILNGDYHDIIPRRATSYYPDEEGGITLREYEFPWFLLSAAGLNATLDDMIAFAKAMSGDEFLDSSWKNRMWRAPMLANDEPAGYALGWDLDALRESKFSAGHEGGSLTTFRVYPNAGLSVVVLTNGMRQYFGLDEIADVLAQSVEIDILAPLDSIAYRAKLSYMTNGLDAVQGFITRENCVDGFDGPECGELLEWLAEELSDAGHDDDAAELVSRFNTDTR
jgi:CubicO group peptidase (beta-lactamase class C family)